MEWFYAFHQRYAVELWLGLAIAVVVILAWLVVAQVRMNRMIRQYRGLVTGTSGGHLEQVLNEHITQVRDTASQVEKLGRLSRQMEKTLRHSLQSLGVVRFNPFSDVGGDQSFAIALVDGHGNGVVISSLYGRHDLKVYAKPLKKWESEYTLTDEEKEAIAHAFRQRG
jgi:hypothetical protein